LRLPPYHCIFNPIETIWSILKRKVRQRNNSPELGAQVVQLVIDVRAEIGCDTWKNCVEHVKKIEKEYGNMDRFSAQKLIINVTADDSDDDNDYNMESDYLLCE